MKLIREGDLVLSFTETGAEPSFFLVDPKEKPGADPETFDVYVGSTGKNLSIYGKELNVNKGGPGFAMTLYADYKYKAFGVIRKEIASRFVQRFKSERKAARVIQAHWRRCIADPSYTMCKRRLMHWEFSQIEVIIENLGASPRHE